MKTQRQFKRLSATLAIVGLAAGLFACGSGGGGGGSSVTTGTTPTPVIPLLVSTYAATSLVVDAAPTPGYANETTRQLDTNLVNAWGLAFNPAGFVWVADNGTSKSTLYDGNGVPQSLVVTLADGQAGPAKPTGIVFNGTQDFKVSAAGLTGASPFIFAGEAGTISGWSPGVDLTHALTIVDNGASGAVYKGLANASFGGANYIYAADFHNNRVDVFDASFNKASLPGSFTDPSIPAGYAPFGIQAIGDKIYVTYAKQDGDAHDDVAGAGLGLVNVFDSGGNLIKQLVTGGALNAPWGVALAPADFGTFSGALLVANFGDGKINVFDPVNGSLLGTLGSADGLPIVIDGLWGIAFGNGINGQPTNTLFFTAGPDDEAHGAYGRIDVK